MGEVEDLGIRAVKDRSGAATGRARQADIRLLDTPLLGTPLLGPPVD